MHQNVLNNKKAKELQDIKALIQAASRPDARSARIKKTRIRLASGVVKQRTKFKVRCSRYLYTLVVDDAEKAAKLQQSLPPGLNIVEVEKTTKAKK
ncbi:ribosomal protein L38e [Hysterangium stoloniferum]|nr:ribosomal protein L38e [Hysterangium stoloniferum]